MPDFRILTDTEIAGWQEAHRGSLAPYIDFLRPMPAGTWVEVKLCAGENRKLIKSHLTKSLRRLGVEWEYKEGRRYRNRWDPGLVIFEILQPADPTKVVDTNDYPGAGRPRKQKVAAI